MKFARPLAICAVGIVCSTPALKGQGVSQYRNFELGSDVAAVAALAGIDSSDAKTTHRRPALLQDLEWRPSRWIRGSTEPSTDPVEQLVFSFYDDQLYRIAVDYAAERTEGMTAADMTEAIAVVYGPPLAPTSRAAGRAGSKIAEPGVSVARWGDEEHAIVLYQTASYRVAFRLVVTDIRLDNLARQATAEALRLDDREAPQREVARQQKDREDGRAAAAKARAVNRAVFRP